MIDIDMGYFNGTIRDSCSLLHEMQLHNGWCVHYSNPLNNVDPIFNITQSS